MKVRLISSHSWQQLKLSVYGAFLNSSTKMGLTVSQLVVVVFVWKMPGVKGGKRSEYCHIITHQRYFHFVFDLITSPSLLLSIASPEGLLSNTYLYFQISMNKYRYWSGKGYINRWELVTEILCSSSSMI